MFGIAANSRGHFHMVAFEAAKLANRGMILEHLTEIVNTHTLAHFSCFIDLDDYRKVNATYAMEEVVGTPYAIAARGMATLVNRWKKEKLREGDRLLTFVERGTKHQGDMDEAFRRDALSLPVPVRSPALACNRETFSRGRFSIFSRRAPNAEAL
ncbi:MAG: hypothetical protein WAN76_09285 [Candidatus Sulfotelmatobacter sp.]